jgi:hypothetical protein
VQITAVYYCEESGPYHMYVLDVCDDQDSRFNDDNFKSILWSIFEEKRVLEDYPKPSSDVVFLGSSGSIVCQLFESDVN